ncbi:MAG: ABC transporter substrate-binding protein [Nitrospina sp.]|nr:ABC transporter substrate-binding protein [Nitrospina sp.]
MKIFTFAPFHFIKNSFQSSKFQGSLSLDIAQRVLPIVLLFLFLSSPQLWADNTHIQSAKRIISTSPSITETLFELGLKDRVIAVTDFCKYPKEACQLRSIGGMLNPSMETVVSLNPDLIIHPSGNQRMASNSKSLGIQTLEVDMGNLEEIFGSIKKLGKALSCQESAEKLLLKLNKGIAFFQERMKGLPKKEVLLLLGDSSDPSRDLYAAGPGTFLNELLSLSGGNNIVRDSPARYPKLSKEYIIEKSPEIIIEAGPKSNLSQDEIDLRIQEWRRFPTIKAVKNQRIHFIGADYILIPGPRLLKIIEHFSKAIHPELFESKTKKTSFQGSSNP